MNTTKRFFATAMLVMALCFTVFAEGQIPAPGITASKCSDGQIPAPGIECPAVGESTLDPVTAIALDLFNAILSVF